MVTCSTIRIAAICLLLLLGGAVLADFGGECHDDCDTSSCCCVCSNALIDPGDFTPADIAPTRCPATTACTLSTTFLDGFSQPPETSA